MAKVSETLGALNVLGRYFLQKTATTQVGPATQGPVIQMQESLEEDLIQAPTTMNDRVVSSPPLLTVPPEQDEQLGSALYTLGRNVLGQVVNFFLQQIH